MKLIANFNIKGGVGKTALNILTGIRLAEEGNKILFIDADSQANLTEYFYDVDHNDKTIADALLKQVAESYRKIRNTLRFLHGNLSDGNYGAFNPVTDKQEKLEVIENIYHEN